jgi:hypothetical protein
MASEACLCFIYSCSKGPCKPLGEVPFCKSKGIMNLEGDWLAEIFLLAVIFVSMLVDSRSELDPSFCSITP